MSEASIKITTPHLLGFIVPRESFCEHLVYHSFDVYTSKWGVLKKHSRQIKQWVFS